MAGFENPLNMFPPFTVWKVHQNETDGYEVSKAWEDRDAEALPAGTTVGHDAQTGRIFLSGMFSPFITVCERKETESMNGQGEEHAEL